MTPRSALERDLFNLIRQSADAGNERGLELQVYLGGVHHARSLAHDKNRPVGMRGNEATAALEAIQPGRPVAILGHWVWAVLLRPREPAEPDRPAAAPRAAHFASAPARPPRFPS